MATPAASFARTASTPSMAPSTSAADLPVADLRARQHDLHRALARTWSQNMRLMDEAEERKGSEAGVGVHLGLALTHAGLAVGKVVFSAFSCAGSGLERVARVHPASAAAYAKLAAAAAAPFKRKPKQAAAEKTELTSDDLIPQLHRRTALNSGGSTLTSEQKQRQAERDRIYVAEDKWQQCESGVWFPTMEYKRRWDVVVMLFIIYSCIDVPFRIGMAAEAEGAVWCFEVGVTLIFLTDLCFNFNTAYLEGPFWVIDRKMIAANYFRGWFIIDSLSSVPVELIELVMPLLYPEGDHSSNAGLKALRALRMVRLLRMLRLLKLQQYIDALEDATGANMQLVHILKLVLALLYLMHLLGCFWFWVANNSGYEHTWLHAYDDGSGVDAPTDIQYLYSVYWALTTLTTVGYGDITPANNAERWYALCCLLIGALVFGYLLSSIGDLLSNVDKNAVKLDAKLDDVKDFTRWYKMLPDLAARVRKYYETLYSRQSAMDEQDLIANLAPSLRREVIAHLLDKTAAMIPMFSNEYCGYVSDDFQLEVHPLLKPLVYELGESVVRKRSVGDGLYFLVRGTVGASAALDDRVLFSTSDTGSMLGEHVVVNQPAELTYNAITRSEFFCMAATDLYGLLERFPNARRELAEFIFEDLLRHKMLRYWAFRMTIPEIRERDERAAAALQLQVCWMRRSLLVLQQQHGAKGAGLAALMPGIFGYYDGGESTRASPRAGAPSGGGVERINTLDAIAVQSALALAEAERSKIQRKDQQLERQLASIQKALEKLAGDTAA